MREFKEEKCVEIQAKLFDFKKFTILDDGLTRESSRLHNNGKNHVVASLSYGDNKTHLHLAEDVKVRWIRARYKRVWVWINRSSLSNEVIHGLVLSQLRDLVILEQMFNEPCFQLKN